MISSWPERIVQAFRGHPPGAALPSPFIARRASLPQGSITKRLDLMAEQGIVVCHSRAARPTRWVLRDLEPENAISRMRQATQRPRVARSAPIERGSWGQPPIRTKVLSRMRTMMLAGPAVGAEQLQRAVADALDAAQAVLIAKQCGGGRFVGAEVDLLVARELRHVSEAASQAGATLRQALEAMGD